jgi:hypothetical protein
MGARCQWLTPVILTTQEAEIGRMAVRRQTWANSSRDLHLKKKKKKSQKKAGRITEAERLPA